MTTESVSAEVERMRAASVSRGVAKLTGIVAERASGAELWSEDGRRYLDFAGGIGVLNTGHCHPRIVAAVQEQAARLMHSAFFVAAYRPYIRLCERLNLLAPGKVGRRCGLFNSGAEAVENAIKIARFASKRSAVIAFEGSFHGRTLLTMTLTGKTQAYKVGFGPYAPEIYHAPFPNSYRRPAGRSEEEYAVECLEALERMFRTRVRARDVACILIEVVQGENGFVPAHPVFIRGVADICQREGILLAVDEIQSGVGRTGKFFAVEHFDVEPNLICFGKSIAAGLPLAGVIGDESLMNSVDAGAIGGTYGGNPVACAAALAVLDVIQEEVLLERSERLGAIARARLVDLQKRYDVIGDVRGIGSMLAIELVKNGGSKAPAPELTREIVQRSESLGLILATAGEYMNVIRLFYPLVIREEQLMEGLAILEEAVHGAVQHMAA